MNKKDFDIEEEVRALPRTNEEVQSWARPQSEEEFLWALRQQVLFIKTEGGNWNLAKPTADTKFFGKTIFRKPEDGETARPYKDVVRISPERIWGNK